MSKSREARKEIVAQVNEKLQKMNEIPAQNFMQIVKALSNTAVLDLIVQTIKTERVELASQQKVKDLKSKAEVIKKVTEKADEKKDPVVEKEVERAVVNNAGFSSAIAQIAGSTVKKAKTTKKKAEKVQA